MDDATNAPKPERAPIDDPYAEIAELYDLEHGEYGEDLDLYLNLATMIGDPILEVGCGSGRILVPLAQDGHRVTGTDRSRAMLARAERAITANGLSALVLLSESDMTDASRAPGGPFGLAVVALNGLLHLETVGIQRRALAALHDALDPRGQLVIDVLSPTPEALRGLEGFHHEGTWTRDDGVRVDKFSSRRIHPATQTIATELWYDLVEPGGALRRVSTSYRMRYIHPAELTMMLELAGFVEWQMYGSYDLDPFDDSAERLIVTAELTPSP